MNQQIGQLNPNTVSGYSIVPTLVSPTNSRQVDLLSTQHQCKPIKKDLVGIEHQASNVFLGKMSKKRISKAAVKDAASIGVGAY